ncbi:hypothetical protein [Enterococcus italicus]|uniref:hypothetical protein n=1 Tax=Enterococcus italicus TaxID=246144 RepID=UPI002073C4D8|nr:hypothetical protein [Enterococcus italicus]MCM6930455.1 hypothetical protein [Enterococcus italicus]
MISKKKFGIYFVSLFCILSVVFGYINFRNQEIMKQELNLDGLFMNIKNVKIDTTESGFGSKKPYDAIVIKIPSIASQFDDQIKEGFDSEKNEIINRESLDASFTKWLEETFSTTQAKKYTNKIEVWYRDIKIVDETYK